MTSPLTAMTRLEADPSAPGRARRTVAAALADPGLDPVRDVATLLVSELVTNAVVHAASAVELEVELDAESVVVRVRDADTGPLVMRAGGGSELDEGGRGFLLVDRLADAWGTEHHGGRKTVWFRLNLAGGEDRERIAPPDPQPAAGERGDAPLPDAVRTAPLLHRLLLPPRVAGVVDVEEHIGELLMRVIDAIEADGVKVAVHVADVGGFSRGDITTPMVARHDLVVADRAFGALEVHRSRVLDDNEQAFAALAADRIALVVAEHGLVHAGHARTAELDFLAEATELLTRSLSVSLSLALVTQIVVPRLAEWCAAYAVDERGRPRRLTVNHRIEERVDAVVGVLESDEEVRQAVRDVAATAAAQRLAATTVVAGQRNHVTVLPLQSRDRTLGVLVLARTQPLDPVAYMAALELARRAALAVDNAQLHEEQVSTVNALQASLLPGDLPHVGGVRLAACYHSASTGIAVGGDFYDAFALPNGRVAVAIGDVCGKGAEAAAVTGMSRDLLRLLLQDGVAPAAALRRLNRALIEHPTASRFCTIALATVSRTPTDMVARLCLAGHPEPVLLRPDGTTELVGVAGDLVGVMRDDEMQLTEIDVPLQPGESLVFYTDGVTERRGNGRMFGQFGVRQTLESVASAEAQVIADTLEKAARSFVPDELRDDLAILVVQRTG